MRIALVGPTHPYKGGIAQHTTVLARRLAQAQHEVDLVSWSAQYPARLYPGQQRVPGDRPEVPVHDRTSHPLSWARPDTWLRVGRSLRAYDAVVVVWVTPVQGPAYATLLRAAGRRTRRLVLAHNVLPHEARAVDARLTRAVLGLADGVLVHSEAEAERARPLVRRGARVVVAAMPPHLPGSAAAPPDPDRPRTDRLLFFGLVRPYKGLDVLLDALPSVPGVSLTVAGEFWGGTAATEEQVARLGLADRVTLRPGYVDAADLPGLFASADALVLPYRSSTASQNVELAAAHGLPVVATTVGTMAEHVRDGVDGLLVPPEDPAALAAALRRVTGPAAEPGLLPALRRALRAPDTEGPWAPYVTALASLAGGPPPRP